MCVWFFFFFSQEGSGACQHPDKCSTQHSSVDLPNDRGIVIKV